MPDKPGTILVIDDDPDVLTAAQLLLKRHYGLVAVDDDPAKLPGLLDERTWDVILLDMNFALGANSGEEGLRWLALILDRQPSALVILMTAYGAVDTAVKAIKQGAIDFVLKPWHNERLLTTVATAMRLRESREQVKHLKSRERELAPPSGSGIIGDSPPMRAVQEAVARVAPTTANVLILGENGTGKEVIAQEIHRQSRRAGDVLISVDLGAVPESLFESELFGHKKGAFTGASVERIGRFQAASGGTLFLDEIGNLPLHLQGKLLSVLEQRQVLPVGANTPVPIDVRLICATNMPLRRMVKDGTFREDLLYRINTVEIGLPPLRERPGDIPLLLTHFIDLYARKYNLPKRKVTLDALDKLCAYRWPGNVRELRHAVERAMIMGNSEQLQAKELLFASVDAERDAEPSSADGSALNLDKVEQVTIEKALRKHAGNISHAAKELGITRTSLYRRMEKYGL
ncbi:MAG TPA: sigma-54 dependent transcriptional regulator [Pseudomonadales bacterium]